MILKRIRIRNFRSIKDSGEFPVARLFGFIGENNSGKSNILLAIESFCSVGAGGVSQSDFNDPAREIVITATFGTLLPDERTRWRSYLITADGEDTLILEKHISIGPDARTGKDKTQTEFHGYKSEPSDWYLSLSKIEDKCGAKPKWADIVKDSNLPDYFLEDGRSNKTIFSKALARYLSETHDTVYDAPDLSQTQALGLQSNVVATLPTIYFLRAITDYKDEIDKRATSTTFRRLMSVLSERIIRHDPRYVEIESALQKIEKLFNKLDDNEPRLESIGTIETKITTLLRKLMPSVQSISVGVAIQEIKDMFSGGVNIQIDDGIKTDVLAKGHGLQRCIVFTLIHTLILNERNQLLPGEAVPKQHSPIILAIEEPELYIHPQLSKLFFDVLADFSETDQVLYTTHSPLFIDASQYENLAIVNKPSVAEGTLVKTCNKDHFSDLEERKQFKGFARFNPELNEMFFAKSILLVEGPEDQMAVHAVLRKRKMIINRSEELDWSIVIAGGKDAMPFYQRVLNSFRIAYHVLHDKDIREGMAEDLKSNHACLNALITELAGDNKVVTFPVKLEMSLGLEIGHFSDKYKAFTYFQEPDNVSQELVDTVLPIFA